LPQSTHSLRAFTPLLVSRHLQRPELILGQPLRVSALFQLFVLVALVLLLLVQAVGVVDLGIKTVFLLAREPPTRLSLVMGALTLVVLVGIVIS
jgi:hypothetical protein